ncbi:DUF2497 domain-containing protein [Blastomonas fulva]|uniref:DUF2497 domain-containing protein n=1 Tax=Blastomonas fulva TaxID=1550728 RepID=A0ABN5B1A8_9SPHN|nr:DUF2497 domain-containing protein [Blastomonas fulva]ASR50607.1 hypothetical protein B5J99_03260 [Blastomonas fulva]
MTRDIGEPSLEEILASIKKVIAEDGRKPRRPAPSRPAPARQEKLAEDVLELTESVEPSDPLDDEPPLVGRAGEQSMRESLAVLATLTEPGVSPQIVRSGETSLEGMVREMLRPMLAEWLDRNLPDMVEALVAKEIGRITGRKG